MKLELLPVGSVPAEVTRQIQERIVQIFPNLSCHIADSALPLPVKAFNQKRSQYNSSIILSEVQRYAAKRQDPSCVLGIVDVDLFVSVLNFVFGEASCPGKAALISLWRLRPEFYGEPADAEVFWERAMKEAVHEVGHTLGLQHCPQSSCVMHFSNSILDTDRKRSLFCEQCGADVALRLHGQNSHSY
jgi:archaemetzincin